MDDGEERINSEDYAQPDSSKTVEDFTDITCESEEPTEEQVAEAMRLSANDSETSLTKDDVIATNQNDGLEHDMSADSTEILDDDAFQCPACGSTEEPQFIHYKKITKAFNANYGCFIWRYCCAKKECGVFFGENYAFDKVANAFVPASEDSVELEDEKPKVEYPEPCAMSATIPCEGGSGTANDLSHPLPIEEEGRNCNSDTDLQPESLKEQQSDEVNTANGDLSEVMNGETAVGAESSPHRWQASTTADCLEKFSSDESRKEESGPAKETPVLKQEEWPLESAETFSTVKLTSPEDSAAVEACKSTEGAIPQRTENVDETTSVIPATPQPSLPRKGRRQKQTVRKKTILAAKAKTRLETPPDETKGDGTVSSKAKKELETKNVRPRSTCKRQHSGGADPQKEDVAVAPKKLRKGYVYELVPIEPPQANLLERKSSNIGYAMSSNECGTQTMGGSHFFALLMEQLVNAHADVYAGSTSEAPLSLPSYVSRRFVISQHLIKRQSEELNRLQEENKRLHSLISLMSSVIKKFGDGYTPELRHLRDAMGVLKREFSFYQEEFVAEAKKSVDNIQAQKDDLQRKIDDVERKNRLLCAKIDLHVKEKEATEERADGYLRIISERDRDVILAHKAKDRAERKLNDTLYVANNAKCAHCQISEKMRSHLTGAIAEKTVLLDKCRKECTDLQRRAEQAERISRILSKDSEKLKFELNNWKSDAERNLVEVVKLKEQLKKISDTSQSKETTSRAESTSPDETGHSDSPSFSQTDRKTSAANRCASTSAASDETSRTPKEAALSRNDVEETTVSPDSTGNIPAKKAAQVQHNVSIMPTPPEDPDSPFSSWLLKDRKSGCSPPVSSSSTTSAPSTRQFLAKPKRKASPFSRPSSSLVRKTDKSVALSGDADPWASRDERLQITGASGGHGWTPVCDRRKSTEGSSKEDQRTSRSSVSRFFDIQTSQSDSRAIGKPGQPERKEVRKRRNSPDDYVTSGSNHRRPMPVQLPFNGPVILKSSNRSDQRDSLETARTNFSSSPLPWQRRNPPTDYNEWESSITDHSSSTRSEGSAFESDIFFSRITASVRKKNYWEP